MGKIRDWRGNPQIVFFAMDDSHPGIDAELTRFLKRRFGEELSRFDDEIWKNRGAVRVLAEKFNIPRHRIRRWLLMLGINFLSWAPNSKSNKEG
ncbi:MAG: hypothetical protein U9Q07_04090 [Planctomycetota bacterium]|nr:hypothetical protein [Planctomycetota bacterium]